MKEIPDFTKSWPSQIAKYYYLSGEVKKCRQWLLKCKPTLKTIGMFVTSFFPIIRKMVINRSNILSVKSDYRGVPGPKPISIKPYFFIQKIYLQDVTFLFVAQHDHPDRKANFDLMIAYLNKHFFTNIIIHELNTSEFEYLRSSNVRYMRSKNDNFIRPKMFNDMIYHSNTEINFIWDADLLIDPRYMLEAVKLLRNGRSFVYPHRNTFYFVPRKYYDELYSSLDLYSLHGKTDIPCSSGTFGGAFGFRKKAYLRIGLENENLQGYVPDDIERLERIVRLGGGYEMTGNELFHIEHFRGPDSRLSNPNMVNNYLEVLKEKSMTDVELKNYVKSWSR
jgi:hypothetical protein